MGPLEEQPVLATAELSCLFLEIGQVPEHHLEDQ